MELTIDKLNRTIANRLDSLDVKTFGLAEGVAIRGDEEMTFPAIILSTGECVNVFGETDKHDVTLYHRLNEISYQETDIASYGSSKGYAQTADMSMLVFGKRKKVSQFQVERAAIAAIANDNTCSVSRSDFNALQVFATEYMGVTYFMGTEYFLFKINYRITSTFNARCINN